MEGLTRRALMSGLAAVAGSGRMAAAAGVPANAGLRDHAARAGLIYGAAVTLESQGDPVTRALYEREARIVTTDLELKFAGLRPTPDGFRFEGADTLVAWARRQNLLVRGHTLIWNESNPDWLKRCSAREVERIFEQHIETVVSRYAGRIHTWDVVNEPFWPDHGHPGGYRQGPWYNALGPDYIPRALKRVRAIDPNVKLCINEAHCELATGWGAQIRPCLTRLATELRHAGVPLDAIGLQAHLRPDKPYDDGRYAAFLHELADTGVALHLTEFDVYDGGFPDDVAQRDAAVAARATAFLDAALAVPAVSMVVNWEIQDDHSFYDHEALARDPAASRLPRPLPFDSLGARKPLWHAMAAAFDRRTA
ncbi:endo-1,4-beta-xylanase [Lichenihabitans sp. Uapishka_5]|uniref:endo-1,4-beta-xylanase n=1 Tax=Lichenihabitans sp. Uapishka_5 TaxID=3037302 RepID=UPI0029E8060D|nr:endo-1,4-beta-xylanase [Lichenihabitans sp. Uapishka_5]MDX7953962.1 endo-1,4-beta-xylanase [Lichenihabitans sp. Uapishka_5]